MEKNEKQLTVLVTSGGTKIKIDCVRSITNLSKGTFGSKIAREAYNRGFNVNFLYAKDSKTLFNEPGILNDHQELRTVQYETFDEYSDALDHELSLNPDIIILAAAVSDYGVENYVDGKIRTNGDMFIHLKPLPKLISKVREKCPKAIICGFKLLVNSTEKELKDAVSKSIVDNDCDLCVGNDLRDIKEGKHKLLIGWKQYKEDSIQFQTYIQGLPWIVVECCVSQYRFKGCSNES